MPSAHRVPRWTPGPVSRRAGARCPPAWVLGCVLVCAQAGTAAAGTLYRCVEEGKPTSFQADPCPATAKTASALAYSADFTPA
ncbi:MAG: hypothetical protein M3Q40_09935, partial [Pseudomonadota bacterium]|nr:hypothetical protein [Pseudomonadota bacterium]